MPKALSGEKPENEEPPIESVDYHRDYGKVSDHTGWQQCFN